MNLKEKYIKQAIPHLKKKFGYKNDLAAPKIKKVTINIGLNIDKTSHDSKFQEMAARLLTQISGQKPVLKYAKKSISSFKIRKGQIVGLMVTLRGARMYDFVEKLINITLPRTRDFRGLEKKSLDKTGNLSIGFKEHLVFPEVNPNEVEKIYSLEAVITNSSKNREEGFELLKSMGFPFKEQK